MPFLSVYKIWYYYIRLRLLFLPEQNRLHLYFYYPKRAFFAMIIPFLCLFWRSFFRITNFSLHFLSYTCMCVACLPKVAQWKNSGKKKKKQEIIIIIFFQFYSCNMVYVRLRNKRMDFSFLTSYRCVPKKKHFWSLIPTLILIKILCQHFFLLLLLL